MNEELNKLLDDLREAITGENEGYNSIGLDSYAIEDKIRELFK